MKMMTKAEQKAIIQNLIDLRAIADGLNDQINGHVETIDEWARVSMIISNKAYDIAEKVDPKSGFETMHRSIMKGANA